MSATNNGFTSVSEVLSSITTSDGDTVKNEMIKRHIDDIWIYYLKKQFEDNSMTYLEVYCFPYNERIERAEMIAFKTVLDEFQKMRNESKEDDEPDLTITTDRNGFVYISYSSGLTFDFKCSSLSITRQQVIKLMKRMMESYGSRSYSISTQHATDQSKWLVLTRHF